MKLIVLSFYPIKEHEMPLVRYRHEADKEIFSSFRNKGEVLFVRSVSGRKSVPADTSTEKHFHANDTFFSIPWKLLRFVRKERPDVVFVHSFFFPFQFLLLRWVLGPSSKFIVQHHAELPFSNFFKKNSQRLAYRKASLFLFAAPELALPFLMKGVIPTEKKILTLMEVSTVFEPVSRDIAKKHLGLGEENFFIWVGRLDANKDPLTVLSAFSALKQKGRDFRLYMLYGASPLEGEVKKKIADAGLEKQIILCGKRPNEEVKYWLSAADYFISASHYEGSGVALCEAMACACVPIVTDIPSFKTMTRNGSCGFLYKPGDAGALAGILSELPTQADPQLGEQATRIFHEDLSPQAISSKLYGVVSKW